MYNHSLTGKLNGVNPLVGKIYTGIEVVTPTDFNYNNLANKPKINEVELVDNSTFEDLGIFELSNSEIENLLV